MATTKLTNGPFFLVPRYAGSSGDGMEEELTDVAGDTKAGTLIATDRYGNKYYENLEDELPCTIPPDTLGRSWSSRCCSKDEMGGLQGEGTRRVIALLEKC